DGQINGFCRLDEFKDHLMEKLAQLIAAAEEFNSQAIKQIMQEIVPEYTPQDVEDVLGKGRKG
ncbi:MAG: hypothetical protein WC649_08155, partial [Desulfobacteria bacterium]